MHYFILTVDNFLLISSAKCNIQKEQNKNAINFLNLCASVVLLIEFLEFLNLSYIPYTYYCTYLVRSNSFQHKYIRISLDKSNFVSTFSNVLLRYSYTVLIL